MNLIIQQATEDSYGNAKENIFLAFDDGTYLGNAFVYPTINYHQTPDTPYLLYIAVDALDGPQAEKVRQALFDAVMKRAEQLRYERADLVCRVYAGFGNDPDKMDFYLRNGFEPDYSMIMEADLTTGEQTLSADLRVQEFSLQDPDFLAQFVALYQEIFVSPFDKRAVEAQKTDVSYKNYYLLAGEEIAGAFSIRSEEDCGWIETLFVPEAYRGMGYAKQMMAYIHHCFLSQGICKVRLEVWELARRAVNLYKACGYREVRKKDMFPGITYPAQQMKDIAHSEA